MRRLLVYLPLCLVTAPGSSPSAPPAARSKPRAAEPLPPCACGSPPAVGAEDPVQPTEDGHDEDDDEVSSHPEDHYEELVHLLRWLKIDRFDRRAANRDLAQVARMVVA